MAGWLLISSILSALGVKCSFTPLCGGRTGIFWRDPLTSMGLDGPQCARAFLLALQRQNIMNSEVAGISFESHNTLC